MALANPFQQMGNLQQGISISTDLSIKHITMTQIYLNTCQESNSLSK
jgi:hypothetical protein